jgi:hypothetical protein
VRARLCSGLIAVLAGAALLSGCTGGEADAPAGTSTSISSPTSAEQSSAAPSTGGGYTGEDGGPDAPPDTVNTDPDTADPSQGALVTVTDIRIGRHTGFDRVVFELDGTGTPGWDARYVDDPASQGSGDPVDVEGDAALQVTLTGIGLPDDTGVAEWSGPDPLSISETQTVTEVAWDATFEGQSVAFIGTRTEAPFRVFLLEDPVRVVVEVVDAT